MADWICSYGVINCPECKRDGSALRALAADDQFRVYFRIAYGFKEEAKKLGCRWDPDLKLWYALSTNVNLSAISKRWRAITPAQAPKAKSVPDLFDVTATVPEQVADQMPNVETAPPPGAFSFDDLMDAIRYADAAQPKSQASVSEPVSDAQRKDNANAR